MISKILQILSLQPRITKVFSQTLEQFFLTVGQNNFDNKIPFHNTYDIHKLCYLLQISSQITRREIGFAVMVV